MMGAAAGADPLATVEGVYQAARRNVRGPDQSGVGAAAAGFTWDDGPRRSCDPVGAILVSCWIVYSRLPLWPPVRPGRNRHARPTRRAHRRINDKLLLEARTELIGRQGV